MPRSRRQPAPPSWPEGWSGPAWVERGGPGAGGINSDAVNWTLTGTLSSPARAAVDPCGFLAEDGGSWGIDWWVGADDRWHVPAREASLRQRLAGGVPVVETALRVPGGDVRHTVWAEALAGGPVVVGEVANDSAAPVALALALRPLTARGVGRVAEVALDGPVLLADGAPALVLPARPSRALLVTASDGDPLPLVTSGAAPPAADGRRVCPEGLAGAVVVVPLAHRASVRFVVPLAGAPAVAPRLASGAETVTRGWRAVLEGRVRIEVPAAGGPLPPLGSLRAHLALAAGAPVAVPAGAEVAVAAATAGLDGSGPEELLEGAGGGEGSGATLWAAGSLVSLGRPLPPRVLIASAAEAAAAHAAEPGVAPTGLVWAAAGLAAASGLLGRCGEERAAATAASWAEALAGRAGAAADSNPGEAAWLASLLGLAGGPAGDGPSEVPAASGRGTDAAATALAAAADLSRGDPRWAERAAALGRLASPTLAWPDVVDPATGAGRGGDGHSALVTARMWSLAHRALVREAEGERVELLAGWSDGWSGLPLEVHGLPTRWGEVSFALRWHGERPAVLWSRQGPAGVTVSLPALDRGWSSPEPAGEALLAPPPRPAGQRS